MAPSIPSLTARLLEPCIRVGVRAYKTNPDSRLAARHARLPLRMRACRAGMASGLIPSMTVGKLDAFVWGNPAAHPHVLYFHGGGYVEYFSAFHLRFCRLLARESGARIVALDYPLYPQAQCAQLIEQTMEAVRAYQREYPDVPLVFAGDSAGGALALTLAQEFSREQVAQLVRLVLISPGVDLSMSNPDIPAYERSDPMLGAATLARIAELWAGSLGVAHPWACPLNGPMEGLPPVALLVGTHEILYPDACRLAQKLAHAGVDVKTKVGEGLAHVWPLYPIPEACEARHHIAQVIRQAGTERNTHATA